MEGLDRCFPAEHNKTLPGTRYWRVRLFVAAFFLLLVACAGPQVQKPAAKGIYHIVKKGETAYSIARAYSISLQDMAEINNINDVSNIREGQVIFIPDADQAIDDVMVAARKSRCGGPERPPVRMIGSRPRL